MKKKLSITIDENLISKLDDRLQDKMLRNRSHLVEVALMRFLEE